jgi:outer membrane usher protein
MTNSLYGPFLIVSPQKSLKDATVSVSSTASTDSGVKRKTFGNVLYTRLTMYKPNNVVVYASNGSLFTSSGSFLFKLTPYARQGFLARIMLEASIAVSGVILHDSETPYDSYSSPIYNVTLAPDGRSVENIAIDNESYFFTDIDGRFILSDLKSGLYMIDLNVGGQWYAAFFEVPVTEEAGYVAIYRDFDASYDLDSTVYDIRTFDDSYAGSVYFELDRYMTEDEYWNFLFSLSDYGEYEDEWDWDEDWEESDYSSDSSTDSYQEYAAP